MRDWKNRNGIGVIHQLTCQLSDVLVRFRSELSLKLVTFNYVR